MEIRFDGKTALVTGAGKGIGRTLCVKLVEAGANVIAVSRTQSDLDSLKKTNPSKIRILCLDIRNWNKTRDAINGVGPVDLLVNNAGVLEQKDLGEIKEEDVDWSFDVNIKAIINITQLIANEMKARGRGGAIVNISSIFSQFAARQYSVYCASKGAVDQLTKSMAIEYGPFQIRVNSVNPTVVRTAMAEKEGMYDPDNENVEIWRKKTPLGRFAETEDIVGPVFFLLSDYAAMVTGISMPVDGGLCAPIV